MNVLIVFTHPDPNSLTASVARGIAARLAPHHTAVVADLSAERFSPTFTMEDLQAYRTAGKVPADVQREQARLIQADSIVFVHPIYWWGAPALLKGWFERVLSNGWAYGSAVQDGPRSAALRDKQVHLVGLGASGASTYERHGYRTAMHTVTDHGVFEYCLVPVASSRILHQSESGDLEERLAEFLASTVSDIRNGLEHPQEQPTDVGRPARSADQDGLATRDRSCSGAPVCAGT